MQVLAIITNNSKQVLLGKLKLERLEDFGGIPYIFPGGTVNEGEEPKMAAIREVREETGLDVSAVEEIGFRVHPKTLKEIHYFHCKVISGDLSTEDILNDDIEKLEWVNINRLIELMPTLFDKVRNFLEGLN